MFLRGGCDADSKSPPLYLLALAEEIRHRLQETHRELSSVIDQLRGSSETDDGADTNAVSPSHIGMPTSFPVSGIAVVFSLQAQCRAYVPARSITDMHLPRECR